MPNGSFRSAKRAGNDLKERQGQLNFSCSN